MKPTRTAAISAAVILSVAVAGAQGVVSRAQSSAPLPEPYRLAPDWPTLPSSMNGGRWGEVIRVAIDPHGDIWVFHRCFGIEPAGSATCIGRDTDAPILKFDPSGKLLTSFGMAMFAFPHGFAIDDEGNIWASDANGRENVLGMSTQGRGQQVFKFSPTGRLLMTLGKAGVAGNGPDTFDQPTGVVVARNGDIFVSDGHGKNNRVVKFSKDGRFVKAWGRTGSAPGELNQPHDIALDSRGRVFVADRSNNRLSIFDQDGNFLDAWTQFGRPSAVFIAKDDTIYVSDSYSNATLNPGGRRGIYVGSARDGKVTAFIPDPDSARQEELTISGASGIAADEKGTVYAADVGPHRLRKYVLAGPR